MQQIEQMDRKQRKTLLWTLAGFVTWQLTEAIPLATRQAFPKPLEVVIAVTGTVGALLFAWSMLRWWQLRKTICRDPRLAAALNDERIRQLRSRAGNAGLLYVILVLALARAWTAFQPDLPATIVIQLGLVAAVAGPIGWYLLAERSDRAC